MIPVAGGILAVVSLLIVVQQVGRVRRPIWAVMTEGAMCALLTGSISPMDVIRSVNVHVIVFCSGCWFWERRRSVRVCYIRWRYLRGVFPAASDVLVYFSDGGSVGIFNE